MAEFPPDFNSLRRLPPLRYGGIERDQYRDGCLKYTIDNIDAFQPDAPALYYWYVTDLADVIFASGYAITKSEAVDAIRPIALEIKSYFAAHPGECLILPTPGRGAGGEGHG